MRRVQVPTSLLKHLPSKIPGATFYLLKAYQPSSDGLQPTSDGLQPTSDGLQPTSDGFQPSSHSLQKNPSSVLDFQHRLHTLMATPAAPLQTAKPRTADAARAQCCGLSPREKTRRKDELL